MRVRTQRVPVGYREVEYLESTGTQYIDTGVEGDSTSYIEFSFQYTVISTNYNRIFGSRSNVSHLLNMRSSASTGTSFYLEWTGGAYSFTGPSIDLQKHIIVLDGINNVYKFDGVVKSNQFVCPSSTGNLYLFGANQGGTDGGKRFYYYKHFKNNILIRNLIPCERLSDNKPGMYDTVNNVFYTNSGTGEFIKGPYKDSYKISYCNGMVEDDDPSDDIIKCHIRGGLSETTYGYNQKVFLNYTGSQSDVSWTFNQGNYVFSGSNLGAQRIISFGTPIKDHVFLVDVSYDGTPNCTVRCDGHGGFTEPTIYKHTSTNVNNYYIVFNQGFTITNEKLFLQIIDLTDWYGAGKEPSTVAEFRNKFTQTYFPTQTTAIQLTEYQINNIGPIYGYNQKLNLNKTSNINGITFKVENNHVTATGTCSSSFNVEITNDLFSLTDGHQYLLTNYHQSMPISNLGYSTIQVFTSGGPYYGLNENDTQNYVKFTSSGSNDKQYYIRFRFENTKTYNMDYYCNLIDLTNWYLSNENIPTVQEFKETFYKDYYPTQKTVRYLNKYAINNL